MKRKVFLRKGLLGVGTLIATPAAISSCDDDDEPVVDPNACLVSPVETAGPFPIKSPAELIRENIVGDRAGIPLIIRIKVEDSNNNCQPLAGVLVDIWHCDAQGNYSEYSGQLEGDFTTQHFLRGRQTTGADGVASFVSIYPGWYPGRAPHLHLEILRTDNQSLLVTQTAFPEDISNAVYSTNGYNGSFDTSNAEDGEFGNSLNRNLASQVSGNVSDGYVLTETIKVPG